MLNKNGCSLDHLKKQGLKTREDLMTLSWVNKKLNPIQRSCVCVAYKPLIRAIPVHVDYSTQVLT